MFSRRTRARLSQVITDVPEKIKLRKQKQKHYFDRHLHKLPNCMAVMPLKCDCHARRNGQWGVSLERRGPVHTWLRCTFCLHYLTIRLRKGDIAPLQTGSPFSPWDTKKKCHGMQQIPDQVSATCHHFYLFIYLFIYSFIYLRNFYYWCILLNFIVNHTTRPD